jgi:hypothetical protein
MALPTLSLSLSLGCVDRKFPFTENETLRHFSLVILETKTYILLYFMIAINIGLYNL